MDKIVTVEMNSTGTVKPPWMNVIFLVLATLRLPVVESFVTLFIILSLTLKDTSNSYKYYS